MEVIFAVNMYCAGCKGTVINSVIKLPGVDSIDVNLVNNTVKVTYKNKLIDKDTIAKAIASSGYKVSEIIDDGFSIRNDKKAKIKEIAHLIIGFILLFFVLYIGMGGPLWGASDSLRGFLQLGLCVVIIVLFADIYINGIKSIFKLHLGMDSLVFISSFASLIYSLYLTIDVTINPDSYMMVHYFYDACAMVLVIVSLGRLIESLSKKKALQTLNEMLKLRPDKTMVYRSGELVEIETKYLQVDDCVLVKPGKNIPVDGFIKSGKTYVDESMLTGESKLIEKNEDSLVYAGTSNKDGSIEVIVTKTNKDSVLNQIMNLVNNASNSKSNLVKMVDKIAGIFVPIVFGIAVLTFCVWIAIDSINGTTVIEMYMTPLQEALAFSIGVLTISCPCALGLATPISLLVGSSLFSKNGVLVNNSEAVERVGKIDAIVLDKTNTLTSGTLSVNTVLLYSKMKDLNDIIYTIEKKSFHPFSEAIAGDFRKNSKLINVTNIAIIPGRGVKGTYKNTTYYIGSKTLATEIIKDDNEIENLNNVNTYRYLSTFVFTDEKLLATILLEDTIKNDTYSFIENSNSYFKKVVLLTGDNRDIANDVAKELGIKYIYANATPKDKQKAIQALKIEGYSPMMVGDGVNDSIALTYSDVSVGLAKGSDIALSSSDFVLMNNDLNNIFLIIGLSKKINRNIKFNLFWAFLYNAIFIPVAAGVFASLNFYLEPKWCALLMVVSSVTVCLNSLFLLRYNNKKAQRKLISTFSIKNR